MNFALSLLFVAGTAYAAPSVDELARNGCLKHIAETDQKIREASEAIGMIERRANRQKDKFVYPAIVDAMNEFVFQTTRIAELFSRETRLLAQEYNDLFGQIQASSQTSFLKQSARRELYDRYEEKLSAFVVKDLALLGPTIGPIMVVGTRIKFSAFGGAKDVIVSLAPSFYGGGALTIQLARFVANGEAGVYIDLRYNPLTGEFLRPADQSKESIEQWIKSAAINTQPDRLKFYYAIFKTSDLPALKQKRDGLLDASSYQECKTLVGN